MENGIYTVSQLIEELQKVKNKSAKVYYERDSWSIDGISRVVEHMEDNECIVLL